MIFLGSRETCINVMQTLKKLNAIYFREGNHETVNAMREVSMIECRLNSCGATHKVCVVHNEKLYNVVISTKDIEYGYNPDQSEKPDIWKNT